LYKNTDKVYSMNNEEKVVISFDLDYTLINNKKGIVNSFNYALRKFNLPEVSKTIIHKMIGIPLNEMFAKFTEIEPSELSFAFREYYTAKGIYQSKLLSGAKNTLKDLKAQNFTLGVITSKKQSVAIKIAEYLEIDSYFDFILGESDSIKSKLDPNLTDFLLGKYPKYKFIIIGDHPKDAMLAKNLNCLFIGVLTGVHSKHQLEQVRKKENQIKIVKSVDKISTEMIYALLHNANQEKQF
jgi:phosphoglycolate phosphatase